MRIINWLLSIILILTLSLPSQSKQNRIFINNEIEQKNENNFDLCKLKNLQPIIPTGKNLTNLRKSEFLSNGYKFKPSSAKTINYIYDIKDNGDHTGKKTENIVDIIMIDNGYSKLDGKYNGNNGFDGIYIKGSVTKPTEIIIIESKQFRYVKNEADSLVEHGSIQLSSPNPGTDLPAQMSDAWVITVAQKLNKGTSEMIIDNPNLRVKYVFAVDKVTGEINFLKLGKY